jgi:hypothetical protein
LHLTSLNLKGAVFSKSNMTHNGNVWTAYFDY